MRKLLVVVVALGLALAGDLGLAHAGAFSNKSFKGSYALVLSGTDVSQSDVCPAPPCAAALTGQLSTNGKGTITGGSVNLNVNSVTCSGTVTQGLYSVAKSGTGSIQNTISKSVSCSNGATFPIGSLNLNMTLYNSGRQATLATLFTAPDGLVLSGTASTQNRIP